MASLGGTNQSKVSLIFQTPYSKSQEQERERERERRGYMREGGRKRGRERERERAMLCHIVMNYDNSLC